MRKTTKKKAVALVLIGVTISVPILVLVAWKAAYPSSAINRENAAKIQPGMPLAELEALLGGPPRREGEPTQSVKNMVDTLGSPSKNVYFLTWYGPETTILVGVHREKKCVTDHEILTTYPADKTSVRWWLRRLTQ